MKYNKDIEREQLNQLNELLILFMKEYPKKSLYLTAIGNSISNAFSIIEPGPLLLDRNLSLIDVGKKHGIVVKKNHLTRSENNNSLTVADWIQNNYSEQDSYNWNIEDYKRHIANGNPLLTEAEINKYFKDGNNDSIKDIVFDANHSVANIVILNLGTGSFLDIFTRHGSITPANIVYTLNRDIRGISAILELIQNNNRKNKAHTQVYLCGAPKIANTSITDLAMNPGIKKIGKEYANVTYIPSFPRQAFYKNNKGKLITDPHYNDAEYYHLLKEVEKNIIDNFLFKDLMIDVDNLLYTLSNENDIHRKNNTSSYALDIIYETAKKYEFKNGDYNAFVEAIKRYLKNRYSFDFYRLSPDDNLANKIDSLKRKR